MNRYRFDQIRSYASSHNLQIIKSRQYFDDDKLIDYALVGFERIEDLRYACETLKLSPLSIRVIKGSNLHNSIKLLTQEEISREIISQAKRGSLTSDSSSYHSEDEMHFPFVVNREIKYFTKLTTNRNKLSPIVDWLSNFWNGIINAMSNEDLDIAGKKKVIQTLCNVLNRYNNECVSDQDWATGSLHAFQARIVEGLEITIEKEEQDVFVKYMDSLTKIVTDYVNMNDTSMLVVRDYWLSQCNYDVVPIKFSMVDKYSENIIHILGAVAYGEFTV